MDDDILIDCESPTWRGVRVWAQRRIEELKSQLLADAEPLATARLRGQAAALGELLRLEEIASTPIIEG